MTSKYAAKRKANQGKVQVKTEELKERHHIASISDLQEGRGPDDDGSSVGGQKLIRLPTHRFYAEAQIRTIITEEQIQERKASMEAEGQITPIKVYPADENGNYKILHGECRWRAASRIPNFLLDAIVDPEAGKYSEIDIIYSQRTENSTIPLDIRDEARIVYELINVHGEPVIDVARRLGHISSSGTPVRGKLYRLLAFHELPEDGKALYSEQFNDLVTFQELSKIHSLDPDTYRRLVDLIEAEGHIPRKRVENERKRLEGKVVVDPAVGNPTSSQPLKTSAPTTTDTQPTTSSSEFDDKQPSKASDGGGATQTTQAKPKATPKPVSKAPSAEVQAGPVQAINVLWNGTEASILFERKHSDPKKCWLEVSGEPVEADVADLVIDSIT